MSTSTTDRQPQPRAQVLASYAGRSQFHRYLERLVLKADECACLAQFGGLTGSSSKLLNRKRRRAGAGTSAIATSAQGVPGKVTG